MAQLWYWCISAMPHTKNPEFHCDCSLHDAWNPHFFGGFLFSSSNPQVHISKFDPLTSHNQSIFIQNKTQTEKTIKKIALLCFSVASWLEIRSLYLDTCIQVDYIILWVIKYYCSAGWDMVLTGFKLCFFFFPRIYTCNGSPYNYQERKSYCLLKLKNIVS